MILHGKREAAEQKQPALSTLPLASAMTQSYERNGEEYTLRCYVTQGDFRVSMDGMSAQAGYGCLTVERIRVK